MNHQLTRLYELSNGESYGVFIDDTGSSGIGTPWLHKNRKTYVGVVIPPEQMPEIIEQMPGAIEELGNLTGEVEFHFSELINQNSQIPAETKLGITGFMASIFSKYRFPVFVQTFDPELWKKYKTRMPSPLPKKIGEFNSEKYDEMALLFLLVQVKKFIESQRSNSSVRAEVFVDGGLVRQGGSSITMEGWDSVFKGGAVHFSDSKEIFPIQLADFAAFCLNKQQLLVGRQDTDSFSDFNMNLLEIITDAAINFQNIDFETITVEQTDNKRWKSRLEEPQLESIMRKFSNRNQKKE